MITSGKIESKLIDLDSIGIHVSQSNPAPEDSVIRIDPEETRSGLSNSVDEFIKTGYSKGLIKLGREVMEWTRANRKSSLHINVPYGYTAYIGLNDKWRSYITLSNPERIGSGYIDVGCLLVLHRLVTVFVVNNETNQVHWIISNSERRRYGCSNVLAKGIRYFKGKKVIAPAGIRGFIPSSTSSNYNPLAYISNNVNLVSIKCLHNSLFYRVVILEDGVFKTFVIEGSIRALDLNIAEKFNSVHSLSASGNGKLKFSLKIAPSRYFSVDYTDKLSEATVVRLITLHEECIRYNVLMDTFEAAGKEFTPTEHLTLIRNLGYKELELSLGIYTGHVLAGIRTTVPKIVRKLSRRTAIIYNDPEAKTLKSNITD